MKCSLAVNLSNMDSRCVSDVSFMSLVNVPVRCKDFEVNSLEIYKWLRRKVRYLKFYAQFCVAVDISGKSVPRS